MHDSCYVKYLTPCNVSTFSICAILAYLNHLLHTSETLGSSSLHLPCPLSPEGRWSLCEYHLSGLRRTLRILWYAMCNTELQWLLRSVFLSLKGDCEWRPAGPELQWLSRRVFLSEGWPQEWQVSVRLKLSGYPREGCCFLEGDHIVVRSWWRLETSGSPRAETRLLSRLCIELAKGQRDT